MPSFCSAYGCSNNGEKEECRRKNVSFHSFPLNRPELLQRWLINMKRANFFPKKSSQICSEHFEEDCFVFQKFTNRRLLKLNAAPTKFNFKPTIPMRKNKRISYQSWKSNEMNSNENSNVSDDVYHSSGTQREATDNTWVEKPRVFIITCKPADDKEKQDEDDDVKILESPSVYPQQAPSPPTEQPTQSSPCRKRKSDVLHEDYEDAAERRHREKMQRWDRLIDLMEELVEKI